MKREFDKRITAELAAITAKLDTIEEYMAWLIKPEQRFRIGQRVEWSRKGRKAGFPRRKVAQRGVVKEISGFSIIVNLDGLKQRTSYHHSFFNPVSGPKLF